MALSSPSSVMAQKKGSLGLCEVDCDNDSQCKEGLICADGNKVALKNAGFDMRKANCGPGDEKDFFLEVCFDPKILKTTGGGGGGTFLSLCNFLYYNQ